MDKRMNRRECLRRLGISGLAGGLGLSLTKTAAAQSVGESSGFKSSVIAEHKVQDTRTAATLVDGKVIQPRRELPILHETDVLVVGAGPAGVTAAIAAKRAGASVTLVERYGHFGGLWTGGLVLLVIGHIVKGGKQVCQGIGEEIMRRLDKIDGAIIDRRPGVNPTADAEAVKYVMLEMIEEAGVNVFLHWPPAPTSSTAPTTSGSFRASATWTASMPTKSRKAPNPDGSARTRRSQVSTG